MPARPGSWSTGTWSRRSTWRCRIIASLRAGRRIEHFVTERVRNDGRRIHVSLTISPVKDEAGNVVGASKIVRDVTQQHEAEERERRLLADAVASNAKFRALFDQGALFAVILDVDGAIVEPNRVSLEGCGYAREQVVGRPLWEGPWWSASAAPIDQVRTAVAEAAAGKTIRAEWPYVAADGAEHALDMTIVPVRDETGRVLFLAATGSDVTERRAAERERQIAQNRFAVLAELAQTLSQTLDPDAVGERVADNVRMLLRARASILYTLTAKGLVIVAVSGATGPGLARGFVLAPDTGMAWLAIRNRQGL